MTLAGWLAVVMLVSLLAYALLAGADFGAGVWDLVSRGERAPAHRRALAAAIGPVWEANHVWLIFLVVLLFTCFPSAFAEISVTLFWPLHLILVGIVLRGASFVFRAYASEQAATQQRWGHVFGASSAVTPVLLGMCLAAVSTGGMRADAASPGASWMGAFALSTGLLTLSLCAYLAAVYLACEADDPVLQDDFRRRAVWCWYGAGVLSVATLLLARGEAHHLWAGLTALPGIALLGAGAALAPFSYWALQRRRFGWARVAGAAQVGALLIGWGVAQWPYVIYPDLTVEGSAAPASTLRLVAMTLPIGLALLLPSLWFLFVVFKGRNPQQG